jgi:hypothetical protein
MHQLSESKIDHLAVAGCQHSETSRSFAGSRYPLPRNLVTSWLPMSLVKRNLAMPKKGRPNDGRPKVIHRIGVECDRRLSGRHAMMRDSARENKGRTFCTPPTKIPYPASSVGTSEAKVIPPDADIGIERVRSGWCLRTYRHIGTAPIDAPTRSSCAPCCGIRSRADPRTR